MPIDEQIDEDFKSDQVQMRKPFQPRNYRIEIVVGASTEAELKEQLETVFEYLRKDLSARPTDTETTSTKIIYTPPFP